MKNIFSKPQLALPMPSGCKYDRAKNIIRAVFNKLGARIIRESDSFIIAEVQPDVFIEGSYHDWRQKGNKIHWMAVYNNTTSDEASCYTSIDRPVEHLANDVRNRLFPMAVTYCKNARSRHLKTMSEKLTGKIRRAQLETIMGPMEDCNGQLVNGPYTLIVHPYDLEHEKFSARVAITVHHWHCLLMIARLLKESDRLS